MTWVLAIVFGTLCLGLHVAFLCFSFFSSSGGKVRSNMPQGNMGWPLLGETLKFLTPHKSNSLGNFLQDHCSRYGKIFKSHLFGSPTIVSCDYDFNKFILQNEEVLFRTSYPKPLHGILGKNSLILVSGDLHKKLRNVAVHFINGCKSTSDFLLCVEKLSLSMMDSWKVHKQVSFHKDAKMFALNLMVNSLLSIEPEEPRAEKILADYLTYMKGFVSLPLCIPGSPYAMAVKARARLSSTVKEIIDERRSSGNVGLRKGDFLDVIMCKECLSDEERVSVVLDILLGGYETTATLMALIVYFLDKAPHALQTLKVEHQAIRRNKKPEEPLNWEDYKQMEFTDHVICEALRCGNVVKFVHRKAIRDIEFKGLCIPKGWKVLPVFTGAHFDPILHENPLKFDPWRWNNMEEGNKTTGSKKMIAFGGGVRLCPGSELAKVVISFFLHHLVLHYRWKIINVDDYPLAHPYVEFTKGLQLEIAPTAKSRF